jgi:dipeptidase D
VAANLEALRDRICDRLAQAGASLERDEAYPGWKPDLASPLLARCQEVFSRLRGRVAPVGAVHAGLECGIIGEQIAGMDMISFGPEIRHPHSPDEYVVVSSVARTFEFLLALTDRLSA